MKFLNKNDFDKNKIENAILMGASVAITSDGAIALIARIKKRDDKEYTLATQNEIKYLGYTIKMFVGAITLPSENFSLEQLQGRAIRIVEDDNGEIYAIGHFLSDRFALISEIITMKSDIENDSKKNSEEKVVA